MSTSRSAKGTDPALDQLLLGLAAGAEAADDDAWVKRVASRAGPFAGTPALSRSELDALLAAPFPTTRAEILTPPTPRGTITQPTPPTTTAATGTRPRSARRRRPGRSHG